MPNAQSKFVEVYRASHPLQAHAIKLALEEAGIPLVIENEGLQDGIGDLPCGWATSPRLMVEDQQVAAARAVIEQTDRSLQTDPQLTARETAVALTAGMFGLLGATLVADMPQAVDSPEATRCLACNAIMGELDSTCPNCGWTYESESASESD